MVFSIFKDLESKIQEYLETSRDLNKIERKWGIAEASQPGSLRDAIMKDIHLYSIANKYLLESMDDIIEFCVTNELIKSDYSVQTILNVLISDEDLSSSWSLEIFHLYIDDYEHKDDVDFLLNGAAFAISKFNTDDLINKDEDVTEGLLKGVIIVRKKFIEALDMLIDENSGYLKISQNITEEI